MTINSMTGFARASGKDEQLSWVCEIKTVNGRSQDIRCRFPAGYERVEIWVRGQIAGRIKRGSINVNMSLTPIQQASAVYVNHDLLNQLIDLQQHYQGRVDTALPRLDTLLTVRGVVAEGSENAGDEDLEKREQLMIKTWGEAIDQLESARSQEGQRLLLVLSGHLQHLSDLIDQAGQLAACQPSAIFKRLQDQLQELLGASPLAPERLTQEAALLATKADIREELDRLQGHHTAVAQLLKAGGAIGRQLDFLCQELNREANTLCSKSAEMELTAIGVQLKTVIEQFREQVQNVE